MIYEQYDIRNYDPVVWHSVDTDFNSLGPKIYQILPLRQQPHFSNAWKGLL